MSVSDVDLARIRTTGTYRAAVWVTRLFVVLGLGWSWLLVAVRPTGVVTWLWPLSWVCAGCVAVLLRRSGVRVARVFLLWHVEDKRIAWRFFRDLFWFRRP